MRATFLAGGEGDRTRGRVTAADDRPRADARVPARHPRAAAAARARCCSTCFEGGTSVQAVLDRRAHRLPRPARADDADDRRAQRAGRRRRASWRRCSTRRPRRCPARARSCWPSGDNVGASPANSGLLEDMPAIDVENAWGLDATSYGNHEFDYGVERLLQHQARAHFPFLGAEHRRREHAKNPDWVKASTVFNVNGRQGRRHRRSSWRTRPSSSRRARPPG